MEDQRSSLIERVQGSLLELDQGEKLCQFSPDILILNSSIQMCEKMHFVKPPSLWCFVTAAEEH